MDNFKFQPGLEFKLFEDFINEVAFKLTKNVNTDDKNFNLKKFENNIYRNLNKHWGYNMFEKIEDQLNQIKKNCYKNHEPIQPTSEKCKKSFSDFEDTMISMIRKLD